MKSLNVTWYNMSIYILTINCIMFYDVCSMLYEWIHFSDFHLHKQIGGLMWLSYLRCFVSTFNVPMTYHQITQKKLKAWLDLCEHWGCNLPHWVILIHILILLLFTISWQFMTLSSGFWLSVIRNIYTTGNCSDWMILCR